MDENYERSADMRLLELEREARGGTRRILRSTSYTDPDALADTVKDDDAIYAQSGTILVATIDAQPRAGLIPGALITVSLAISNEGDTAAQGVRLSLPLPVDTLFRPGSLVVDGAAGSDALAYDFFGNGAEMGDIEPGTRRSLALKLGVEAGVNDILLNPQLSATSGAILGLRAMRLKRSEPAARSSVIERPFYETEDVEDAAEPQTEATEVSPLADVAPAAAAPVAETSAPFRSFVESVRSADAPVLAPQTPQPKPRKRTPSEPNAKPIALPAPPGAPILQAAAPAPPPPIVQAAPAPPPPPIVQAAPAPPPPPIVQAAPAPPPPIVQAVPAPPAAVVPIKTGIKRARDTKPDVKPILKAKEKKKAKPAPQKIATVKGSAGPRSLLSPAITPVERPKLEVVRSLDDRLSIAAKGGPILMVRIDRKRLSTLGSLFAGQSFGMIAHYLVLNALAAKEALPGDHADGSIAAFVAEQEQLLSRALISTRLGKPVAPESVSANLPAFHAALTTHVDERTIAMPAPGELLLFRAFERSEVAFLERVLSNENSFPFMRAAHLFVGLCANDAAILRAPERRNLAVALSAYTALATAEISRIFLRAKLSREPELFKATEPAFDDAARTVLAALNQSLV